MARFKVGDRVKVVRESGDPQWGSGGGSYFNKGHTGRIERVLGTRSPGDGGAAVMVYHIEFDSSYESWCAREDELGSEKADGLLDI